MIKQSYTLGERERIVTTYDDVFPLDFRHEIYSHAIRSSFKIGWEDNDVLENRHRVYLHSRLSNEDIDKLGILFHLARSPVFAELDGLTITRCVLNLSTPSDVYFAHSHPEAKVMLYYVNLQWEPSWYGETLFYDDALKNIVLATPYTPGRVSVFDGKLPHAIRPQSAAGPSFRFTLALFLDKVASTPP